MSVKIAMIGTGYVGLVSGSCFAELGHNVVCIDKDHRKIDMLNAGRIPIYEPGLSSMVERNVKAGRLRFSTDLKQSAADRDAVFICVGTPSDKATGRADLRYVLAAAAEVAEAMPDGCVVVTKSTVPVGTNRQVGAAIAQHIKTGQGFSIASNPEFLREGAAISDFLEPDRVVVGIEDDTAADVMKRIYAPLTSATTRYVQVGIETAELIKYAANGFLAVKLSFINEVADLCEKLGADVDDVAVGMGLDNRIGSAFLKTGPGWGGSCFPKDTLAFQMTAQDAGVPVRIVEAAMSANDARKRSMAQRIEAICDGSLVGKKIAVLGLTFKGQTDDMRESPSLDVLPALVARGAKVHAFDPSKSEQAPPLLPQIVIEDSPQAAAAGSDALVIMTEWKEFKAYDYAVLAAAMKTPLLIDLRNHLDPRSVISAGFTAYHALGKPVVRAAQ